MMRILAGVSRETPSRATIGSEITSQQQERMENLAAVLKYPQAVFMCRAAQTFGPLKPKGKVQTSWAMRRIDI